MSWLAIAHKDVHDAGRSVTIWLLLGLLVLLFVGFAILNARHGDGTFVGFVDGLAGILGVFLPAIALLLGYKSIVHERINGSLLLLLSFPHSRSELVVGKFLGRSVVLLVPVLVALVGAGVVGAILFGTSIVERFPWFLAVTALYGLAFLGVAIGLSMSSSVDRRVTLGAFGSYLLLVMFWNNLVSATVVVLYRFDLTVLADPPAWAYLAHLMAPGEAYYRLLRVGFDVDRANRYLQPDAPWFVDWWVAGLVLVAWIGSPVALRIRRFQNEDL